MEHDLSAEAVAELVDVLGARTVALIGAAERTSTVRHWLEGGSPTAESAWRLSFALRAVRALLQRVGRSTVSAWFWGANHVLGDQTPVAILAKGTYVDCERAVTAAGSFTAI